MPELEVPEALTSTTVFGNTLLDYLIALAIFCGVLLIFGLLKVAVLHRLHALAKRTANDLDDFLASLMTQHLGPVLYVIVAFYFSIGSLTFPEKVTQYIHSLVVIVLTFKVIQVLQTLLVYLLRRWTAKQQAESPMTAAMVKNMTLVIRAGLWVGALLFILDNIGIDITAFVAGVGIGGVAVALAAQAILGDTFSSFVIFMDKPFEVGDFIIVGDFLGTIEHIGFKTTRIRSLGGEQLIFPNSDLTNSRIRNYKRMEERRVLFKLGVIYQTPHEQVKAIPGIIEGVIKEHKQTRFDRAHFQSYGDFALIFEAVYYVLAPDYNTYMDTQQFINLRIHEEFQKAGIQFAYPTQQLYITKTEPASASS